jgi:phage-related protein
LTALLPVITPLIELVGQLATILADQLANIITNVVVPALTVITELLNGDASAAWAAFKELISGVGTAISETVTNILSTIGLLIDGIIGFFQNLFDVLVGNSIIPDLINAIISWVARLPGEVFAALASLAAGLIRIATDAFSRFRSAVVKGAIATIGFVRSVPGRIRSALSRLGSLISSLATAAFGRFRSAISSGASRAIGFARGIPGRIRGALGSLGRLLYSSGRSIIQGLINGIKSLAGSVKDAVGGVLSSARDVLPFSPAKEGPFSGKGWTLFSGRSISEALAEGIGQREAMVRRAALDLAERTQMALTPSMVMPGEAAPSSPTAVAANLSALRTPQATPPPTVVNISLNLTNRGVLGSQFEVEGFLTRAMENLQRTGRLPTARAR